MNPNEKNFYTPYTMTYTFKSASDAVEQTVEDLLNLSDMKEANELIARIKNGIRD